MKESYGKDGGLTPKAAAVVSALTSDSEIVSDAAEELLNLYLDANSSVRKAKQIIEAQGWLSMILSKGNMGLDDAQAWKVAGAIGCVGDIIIKIQDMKKPQK